MLENDLFDSPLPASIDADAAALLEEVNGDVEKARQSYMGYTLAYLEEAMPELYRQIKTDVNLPDAHDWMILRSSSACVCRSSHCSGVNPVTSA